MPAVTTRFQPFDRDVVFGPRTDLAEAEQAKARAAFAREAIAGAAETNAAALGHAPTFTTYVDGASSNDFERVRPDGTILAEFDLNVDVVQWCWEQVHAHAPVRHGGFVGSIKLYADGQEAEDLNKVVGAEEVVITSVVPYARKIERGLSHQAPDGVFESVAALARGRYGNQAQIKFTFVNPLGGGTELEEWAEQHSAKVRHPLRRRQREKDMRQPAIVITFR